jgi:hypothetical protein
MDKDVYYDIPINQSPYSYIKETKNKSNENLVTISVEDMYQMEPYVSEENRMNINKNNFLILLFVCFFVLFLFFSMKKNK